MFPLFIYFFVEMFSSLSQWWVTGGLEDLHPPPPPSREREATPHSLHIWKVNTVLSGRMKYAYHTLTVTVLLSILSVMSTVVVQEKQTISWREWDFAMREHTSGCNPTPLNSFCLTIKYLRKDCKQTIKFTAVTAALDWFLHAQKKALLFMTNYDSRD